MDLENWKGLDGGMGLWRKLVEGLAGCCDPSSWDGMWGKK